MSEEVEIETKELQETIEELQEERKEREQEERKFAWTRYIGLTTAILAVFAAIGALQSGALINESMMDQLRASDKWNEYQASRQKEHLYTIQSYTLLDQGVKPPASQPETESHSASGKGDKKGWKPMPPAARLRQYILQANKESTKEKELTQEAQELERESAHKAHAHHQFAYSVALIQVAISLSAVAALTRMKSVWWLSLVVGLAGVVFFLIGLAALR
jgi:cytochrome c-type biogenesis protein CcmH/NrfG